MAIGFFALLAAGLLGFAEPLSALLTRRVVDTLKPVLAGAAALLLLVDVALARRGGADGWRRRISVALALLAAGSAVTWWNLMQFHYPRHLHVSDTFHYYVGSKYFAELHYTRLYDCVAVADAEAGPRTGVADRTLRDLETNALVSTRAVLAAPERCKRHFSAERWRAFAADVGWFRERVTPARWFEIQRDHGYNPPPAWSMLGSLLANTAPASAGQIALLAALDPLLLAVMFAGIAGAFGGRAACVALIFFGTNLFGVFGWVGGSFLRQTWLVTAVLGICCLRVGRPGPAGALLACSAALRIFPAAILATVGLCAGVNMWRRRRLSLAADERRVAAAALGAAAVIVALSALAPGGIGAWSEFVDNSRVHLATPLKNHVGLATIAAYDPDAVDRRLRGGDAFDRYERWRRARQARYEEREVAVRALQLAFLVLLAFAVDRRPLWLAAILGVGVIPVAFELTNYYWTILLAYGLLAGRRPGVGVALCALSAATWAVSGTWQWRDETMILCSALVIATVVAITASYVGAGPRAGGRRDSGAPAEDEEVPLPAAPGRVR